MSGWQLVALLVAGMVVSAWLTRHVRSYALRRQIIDVPNERSSHSVPTPRGGGLAIVVTTISLVLSVSSLGVIPAAVAGAIAVPGAFIAIVGFLDDCGGVGRQWRLLAHVAASGWLVWWLGGLPPVMLFGLTITTGLGYVFATLYAIWLINLTNFMDGIDGLAATEAITASLGAAVLYVVAVPGSSMWVVPLIVASATTGFLIWNWPPAKIFMGDIGSGFLGVTFAAMSIHAGWVDFRLFWAWVILLGVFIVDATVTLLRRAARGERIFDAHRMHAYQHASRQPGGHRRVTLAVLVIKAAWLFPLAASVTVGLIDGPVAAVLAFVPLVAAAVRLGAGTPARDPHDAADRPDAAGVHAPASRTAPSTAELLLVLRQPLIAVLHGGLVALAWIGAFSIRLDFSVVEPYRTAMLETLPVVVAAKLFVFYAFRLFHGWWKYVGITDLVNIAKATSVATMASLLAISGLWGASIATPADFPRSVFLLDYIFAFLLIGGVRFAVRAYTESLTHFRFSSSGTIVKRVLVVGAGRTGITIVREMRAKRRTLGYEPAAFVDDDPDKQSLRVDGVPVLGNTDAIPRLIDELQIEEVLVAMSTAAGATVRRIIDVCQDRRVTFKIVPSMGDLIGGRISVSRIREVRIDDLLGRAPIVANLARVRSNTEGHVVLVTGAAGSIGSELSRQLAMLGPARIVMFERSESDLHDLELGLRQMLPNVALTPLVGDILDVGDLEAVFAQYRPSRVYHAAAYKHVTLMERHIVAAVRNNIVGTYNVANAAERYGAEQLVLISTDKAVRPTSLMGATKRAAERVLLGMRHGKTRFTIVRFGNVLGSRGSVVPIFKRQIEAGGPVTVTHPDVVRFFMTIPEAAQLVLQAAAFSRGGDIFHLDMGEPVRIAELAENMIRLSGLEPGHDVEIKYVGLRPGEKLYEELLVDGEDEVQSTDHPRVRVVQSAGAGIHLGWVDAVIGAANARDAQRLVALICLAVPEFTPSDVIAPDGVRPHAVRSGL